MNLVPKKERSRQRCNKIARMKDSVDCARGSLVSQEHSIRIDDVSKKKSKDRADSMNDSVNRSNVAFVYNAEEFIGC